MKKSIFLVFLAMFLSIAIAEAQERDLSRMNERRRTEHLLRVAREVVMKHGPDYYRDVAPPVIERRIINEDSNWSLWTAFPGRIYYTVTYLYDEAIESFSMDYAARVEIWENTGLVFGVIFGNGHGLCDLDDPEVWPQERKDRERVMPFERQPPRERRDGERGGGGNRGGRPR